jgi:tetratricopeptide (TPR) repeat protein
MMIRTRVHQDAPPRKPLVPVSSPACILGALALGVCLLGCSSAPKRPAEIFTLRNTAAAQLELANHEADRGNYPAALDLMAEARRMALHTDNPALRIRTALSLGNVLFFLDRPEEAEARWNEALAEAEALAEHTGDRELAAIGRIYLARARLLTLTGSPAAPGGNTFGGGSVEDVRSRVQAELGAIKTDNLALALGWTVIGLAEKELRRWAEAEAALKKALDLHARENYLEQAAYDWYLIASVRSVGGRYDAALEALEEALAYDRRAENTYGLGKDWLALGDVYTKAGRTAEARSAYRRAGEIFNAAGFEAGAGEADRRGGL